MKVFLDTNILLDTLVERSNQVSTDNAITLLGLGEKWRDRSVYFRIVNINNSICIEEYNFGPPKGNHQRSYIDCQSPAGPS